jgi:ArsR family transcriptional regulator, arsenate/arsenite/antimonite-responsive transcriptional repressor
MESEGAILALTALAQWTRLEAFRLLVKHEPEGIAAGELARLLSVPQNTLSAHFNILAGAGLVKSKRRSRSVIYRAQLDKLEELLLFLLRDCCSGRADVQANLMESVTRQLSAKARGR